MEGNSRIFKWYIFVFAQEKTDILHWQKQNLALRLRVRGIVIMHVSSGYFRMRDYDNCRNNIL